MSTVKAKFKDILAELDKSYDNFYIKNKIVYSKEDKEIEAVIKVEYCTDDTLRLHIRVLKTKKLLSSVCIDADDLSDSEEKSKIADVLDKLNDEIN